MRTFRYVLVGASMCLTLAGCGKKDSDVVDTATVAYNAVNGTAIATETSTSAQPAAGGPAAIQPGNWDTTTEVTELVWKGNPAEAPPKPGPIKATICVTPEQASKGPGALIKNAKADCTTTRNVYEGGKIDVAMNCKIPGGAMTTKTTGTYTATTMTSDAEMEMTGQMTMGEKFHTTAKRVGDCTG